MSEALLKIAAAELGTTEIRGPEHNPSIVRYAQEVGLGWIYDDETPWCSIFMNWCAKRAGLERSGSPRARSWLTVGAPVEYGGEKHGDVVVLQRGGAHAKTGHVGIYLGYTRYGASLYILGGNQRNQVGIDSFPRELVLSDGFRRLGPADPVPRAPLAVGGRGPLVKQLQQVLVNVGFDPGPIDGAFGMRTAAALSAAQAKAFEQGLTPAEQAAGHYGVVAEQSLRALLKNARVQEGSRAPV